ncbi:MAG: HD domain-containing protein [Planctomycetia bacterium]|nr:HD domain-containing protein [Planctomycetia bacterium]
MTAPVTYVLLVSGDEELAGRAEQAISEVQGAIEAFWGTFEIICVPTLRQALAELKNNPIDVAIVEMDLSDADGLAATDRLMTASPSLAVIVLAREPDSRVVQAIQMGAQDYLLEPDLSSRTLIRTLHASIERKRAELMLHESRASIIWRLAKAAEMRDEETGNHVIRVGCFSRIIAETLSMPREFTDLVFLTAPLHDIGKIGIPDAILLKRGRLTAEERAVMERHCQIGAAILRDDAKSAVLYRCYRRSDRTDLRTALGEDRALKIACNITIGHHERWDGTGYPHRLAGKDVPLEARIVAVCDVWDALRCERVYKKASPEDQALEMMLAGKGSHFDPVVFDAFMASLDELRVVLHEFADAPPKPLEALVP